MFFVPRGGGKPSRKQGSSRDGITNNVLKPLEATKSELKVHGQQFTFLKNLSISKRHMMVARFVTSATFEKHSATVAHKGGKAIILSTREDKGF